MLLPLCLLFGALGGGPERHVDAGGPVPDLGNLAACVRFRILPSRIAKTLLSSVASGL